MTAGARRDKGESEVRVVSRRKSERMRKRKRRRISECERSDGKSER